jgi:hypothetical protein
MRFRGFFLSDPARRTAKAKTASTSDKSIEEKTA